MGWKRQKQEKESLQSREAKNVLLREFQKIDAATQCGMAKLGRINWRIDGNFFRQLSEVCRYFRRENGMDSIMTDPSGKNCLRCWDVYFIILSKILGLAPRKLETFFNRVVQCSTHSLDDQFNQAASWW